MLTYSKRVVKSMVSYHLGIQSVSLFVHLRWSSGNDIPLPIATKTD